MIASKLQLIWRLKAAAKRWSVQQRKSSTNCDLAIIGGGIIGTAIGRQLKLDLNHLNIQVLEKGGCLGGHQSSHNSGVMHCGIYYPPGSLKARLCVQGIDLLQRYCSLKGISYNKCGKLIVASDCNEAELLNCLLERARDNQVEDVELLDSLGAIQGKSTGCRGVRALWCARTANVSFRNVTQAFGTDFQEAGGIIHLNTEIVGLRQSCNCEYPLKLTREHGETIGAKFVILCGGLQAARLTHWVEGEPPKSSPQRISLKCRIGGHHSWGRTSALQSDGNVLLGPWAVPALKLEGYSNDEINMPYLAQVLGSCNFRNMVRRNSRSAFIKPARLCVQTFRFQIKELQKLMPNFSYQFAEKGPSAVQCQLVNLDGSFVDDFVFEMFRGTGVGQRVVNLKFTPSPAATSCMSIAELIAQEVKNKLDCTASG
ncbi:hypothetical protein YQE_02555, partial [Dendroctonus ponderosae]